MTDWIREHRFVSAGLVMILAQLLFRAWWAADGYFWQDDFRYLAQAQRGLSLDVLLQDYNGHLLPGSFIVSRVVVALGSSYTVALGLLLLLQLVAGLLLLWVIDLIFERRLASLVVLGAALFTPLTLVGISWYAYGLQLWPVQIATLACVGGYVRWRETGAWRWLGLIVVSYVVGLIFWEKALLIPGVLVLLSVLVLDRSEPVRARLWRVARQWELWLPLIALTACYVAIYLDRATPFGGGSGQTEAAQDVDFLAFLDNGLLRTLLPGLLGGPWTDANSITTVGATPHVVATVLALLVWVAILVISVVRHPARALQAWLWVATIVAIDYILLAGFRPTAEVLVRDSRYIADAVPVVALSVLAALLPVRGEAPEVPAEDSRFARARATITAVVHDRPRRVGASVCAVAVVLAGAGFSTVLMGDGLRHAGSRWYVTTLEDSIRSDPRRAVLDSSAPFPGVFFGTVEEVATGMGLEAAFADAGQGMEMFDRFGKPREVAIKNATYRQQGPRQGCGWLLKPDEPVEVKTGQKQIPWPQRVLQIGYYGKQPDQVTVIVDGKRRAVLPAADGLGTFTVRTPHAPKTIRLTVDSPGASLCITDLTIGIATPKPTS